MNDTLSPGELAQRLADCEVLLRAGFETAPVGMGHLGLDGRWLRVNARLAQLFQQHIADWQGRPLLDLLHPDDAALLGTDVDALLGGRLQTIDRELRLLPSDEAASPWCHLKAELFRDAGGGARFITCVFEEITPRRRDETRARYLAAIVDSTDDGIIGKDPDGRILSWNRGAEAIYSYTESEMIGRPVHVLAPPELHAEIDHILAGIRKGLRVEHYQTVRCRKDGSRIHVALTVSPVQDRDGRIIGASTISRDITAQVAAAEELRHATKVLDTVFSNLHVQLAYMDRDFNFIRVNRAYAAADTHTPDFFVGKNHFDLYPDAENEAMFLLVVETGRPSYVAERPSSDPEHPERGVRYWDWVLYPALGRDGRVEALVLSITDVTEKVRVKQQLESTAAYTRSLIEANLDPLVTIGRDGRITDVNGATETVTGRSREQLNGTDFSDYFTAPLEAKAGYRLAFEQGSVRDCPLEIRHSDGHITPVLFNASVYRDRSGEVAGVLAAARDITERRQAEEAIRQSEARLRESQRIAHLGSWELDLEHNVLSWSDEIYRIFEIDKGRFGASYEAFLTAIHPDDRGAVDAAYTESLRTREPYSIDHRLRFPDGRIKNVHEQCETSYDDGRPLRSIGTVQDITDRKQAEEALKQANAYNRRLIEASLDPLVTIGADGRITDVNAATEFVTGRAREALIGTDFSDYFTSPEQARAVYREVFELGFVRDYPLDIRHADSHTTPVLYNASIYRDEKGEVAGVFAAARDITERKRSEEELVQAYTYTRSIIEGTFDPMIVIGPDSKTIDVNKAFEEATGFPRERIIGGDFSIYVTEPEQARVGYRRVYEQGYVRDFPLALLHTSGRTTDVLFHATLVKTPRGPSVLAMARDITERKHAEELLKLRTQEQEAIATLGYRALTGAPLDALIDEAVRLVAGTLAIEYCKVLQLMPDGHHLLLRAGVGWKDGLVGKAMVSAGLESQAGYTLLAEEPVIVPDFPGETRFSGPPLLSEHGVKSGMSVIIRGRERPFGVLGAHTIHHRTFTKDDVTFLQAVANVIATAVERAQAEDALRVASTYNRRLIEASLDPLVTIGKDGRITDVNAATEAVTGRAREQLIGTDFSDYFTEPERAKAVYLQVFEQGYVRDYPLQMRHADRRITPVLYNATVYRDETGATMGLFASAHDVTALKQAEGEVLRLSRRNELLLHSAGEGIYGIDTQGKCTFINPSAASMLGYAPEELLGRSAHEIFHHSRPDGSPYPVSECPMQKAYSENAVVRGTNEVYWRRDGSDFPIEYVSTPIIEEGQVLGAVIGFLDITERKQAEEALRQLNRELDERVKARTAQLEAANKELEGFSYSISHDLRTPLRAIDGFSKILLTDYESRLDEEGKRLLHIVRENTEKMAQLIGDILTFSRTGRAEMKLTTVDVRALVRDVWEDLVQLETGRQFDFRLAELPPAAGDRNLLRQVFVNLLSNAVKFTRPREVARIEVGYASADNEVIYQVRDNGVGFDMKYVERLFGVFQRLHSTTEFEGTGIGLAVVQRIVARHGGRVFAESVAGKGATFYVALPRGDTDET